MTNLPSTEINSRLLFKSLYSHKIPAMRDRAPYYNYIYILYISYRGPINPHYCVYNYKYTIQKSIRISFLLQMKVAETGPRRNLFSSRRGEDRYIFLPEKKKGVILSASRSFRSILSIIATRESYIHVMRR